MKSLGGQLCEIIRMRGIAASRLVKNGLRSESCWPLSCSKHRPKRNYRGDAGREVFAANPIRRDCYEHFASKKSRYVRAVAIMSVRIGPSLRCSTRGTQFARTDTLENREAESAPPAWKRVARRMRVADDHPPHKQGSSKLLSPAIVEKAPVRCFSFQEFGLAPGRRFLGLVLCFVELFERFADAFHVGMISRERLLNILRCGQQMELRFRQLA